MAIGWLTWSPTREKPFRRAPSTLPMPSRPFACQLIRKKSIFARLKEVTNFPPEGWLHDHVASSP